MKDCAIRIVDHQLHASGKIKTVLEERVPVWNGNEIAKDKVGRTIWKVVRVPYMQTKYVDIWLVDHEDKTSWMSTEEIVRTFGKNKYKKALKTYKASVVRS